MFTSNKKTENITISKNIFKVTLIGMSGVGKTSLLNRLVNNSFNEIYTPTLDKNEFEFVYEYVNYERANNILFKLEDLFGLDNTLLQTNDSLIKSQLLKDVRNKMIKDFQEILLTNKLIERKLLESKNSFKLTAKTKETNEIPMEEDIRVGFIFVIDIVNFEKSYKDTVSVMEKLKHIEKSSSAKPSEKCVVFNKIDLMSSDLNITEKEKYLKSEYNCEVFFISCKTQENFKQFYIKFLNNICESKFDYCSATKYKEEPIIDLEETKGCAPRNCTGLKFTCG